ncbi:MAG: hypothetical protein N4A49_16635 [Marinifilaceae bacterium]|jgi:hypothetical protein|nr:hypothetical protein [Marinifilaceae bacterium]
MKSFYKFSKEQLPAVAEILLNLYSKDRKKFESYSNNFNSDFEDELRNQITVVKQLVEMPEWSNEVKDLSNQMTNLFKESKNHLNTIKGIAQKTTKNLDIKFSEFGINEAKKEISNKDVFAYHNRLNRVTTNIENNLKQLKTNGYKPEMGTNLFHKSEELMKVHERLNNTNKHREDRLTDSNHEFEKLWKFINTISKAGRKLPKNRRLDQYQLTNILDQIRLAEITQKPKTRRRNVVEQDTQKVKTTVKNTL